MGAFRRGQGGGASSVVRTENTTKLSINILTLHSGVDGVIACVTDRFGLHGVMDANRKVRHI